MVSVDGVFILGGNINIKKKTTETLIFVRKEKELEIKADKTKYRVMSRDQKAGQNNNTNFDKKKTLKRINISNIWENLMTKNSI